MGEGLKRSLALANEALRIERQAMVCERVAHTPELAATYLKAAGELNEAAASCPLAPGAARKATELARAAEQLADAASASAGSVARAAALYRQVASKLTEAAEACPAQHPNKAALEDHVAEVSVRVIYLESLNGAPVTVALEDHIGELELLMAHEGGTQEQAEAATSRPSQGATAIAASASGLATPARGPPMSRPAVPGLADSPAGGHRGAEPSTVDGTTPAVMTPAKTDFLQEATKLESKARSMEEQGLNGPALQAYKDCLHLYHFVLRRDKRMSNPNVKQMLRDRMEDLLTRAETLKAQETLNR